MARGVSTSGHSLVSMVRPVRQKVVPHLSYEDPFAALAWLCRVFGFTEAKRFDRGEDNLTARRSWPLLTHAVTVIVDDVDDHFERAEREGAAVLGSPKDQPWGVRSYAALDPEGHQWEFATVTNSSSST